MDISKYRNIIVVSCIVGFFGFLVVLFFNEIDNFIQWFGDALIYLLFLVI